MTRKALVGAPRAPYHAVIGRLASEICAKCAIFLSHPFWIREIQCPGVNAVTAFLSRVVIKSCFHSHIILVNRRRADALRFQAVYTVRIG